MQQEATTPLVQLFHTSVTGAWRHDFFLIIFSVPPPGIFFLPAILFTVSMSGFAFVVQLQNCKSKTLPGPVQVLYFGVPGPGPAPGPAPAPNSDYLQAVLEAFPFFESDWNAVPNRGLCPVKGHDSQQEQKQRRLRGRGLAGGSDGGNSSPPPKPKNPPPPPGAPSDGLPGQLKSSYCLPWQAADFWSAFDAQNHLLASAAAIWKSQPGPPLDTPHAQSNLEHSDLSGAAQSMLRGFQAVVAGTVVSWVGLPLSLQAVVFLSPPHFWAFELLLYLAFIAISATALREMAMQGFVAKEVWVFVFPSCDVEVKMGPVFAVLIFQLAWSSFYLFYLAFLQSWSKAYDVRRVLGRDPRQQQYSAPLPFLIALIKSSKPYSRSDLEDFVTYLGDEQVDVNVKDSTGMTPLLWACRLSVRGVKDFFVEQLLACPLIDIEYASGGRNALQWCVAQSTKDLIIAFTKAHLAVKAGHAGPDEYHAAGFSFNEEPALEEAEEPPPPLSAAEAVPVEQLPIEGLPPPTEADLAPDAISLIAAQRREMLVQSMQKVRRLVKVSAALAQGQGRSRRADATTVIPLAQAELVAPTEVIESGAEAKAKAHIARRNAADQELAALKEAQAHALTTLEAKQRQARADGSAYLQDRLAQRRAAKEAELRAREPQLDDAAIAAALASDDAEAALEQELRENKDRLEAKQHWNERMRGASERRRAEQVEIIKRGATDALSVLESKQRLARQEAEAAMQQRLAKRRLDLRAKGVASEELLAQALAAEEAQVKAEMEDQLESSRDAALRDLVAKIEAQGPAQTANTIKTAAALSGARMDAELASRQAAAKAKLQERLHKDSAGSVQSIAIPSSAAALLLRSQDAATSAVLESDLKAKQAAAKKRLMERMKLQK